LALWLLGYPEAALADADQAVREARQTEQATTVMLALAVPNVTRILCRAYATARPLADELIAVADEKGASLRKAEGRMQCGCILARTAKTSDAIQMVTSGIAGWRSTGATVWLPWYSSLLATAYADFGRFDEAWRLIDESIKALETTGERWCEAEINRIAGELALMLPESDAVKAEGYFERALAIAREQQAKSFELRAAISMARLWDNQGKRDEARDLLAPVYGWFTEGFDTHDLKEAKALLEEHGRS
jgi:predicted ATPase